MESSSSEGFLVQELTKLSTMNNKRSPSPLSYEESKRPRLQEEDMETSSRESRWSRYRDCTNLSTLTEQSDSADNDKLLEQEYNVHVAAHQVPDLEEHIEKLAKELEEWSLVNLKEWRHQQFGDSSTEAEDGDVSSPCKERRSSKAAVRKQKVAKRNLMRVLRHHGISSEDMEE